MKIWKITGMACLLSCFLAGIGYGLDVPQWAVFETVFQGTGHEGNPLQDVRLTVSFQSPSGKEISVLAFWDGDSTWRVRFSPEETGHWNYRTECSSPGERGLNQQQGSFDCVAYSGDNPLLIRGALRLSPNRHYLEHADGTPFFWLADTVWNGALLAEQHNWDLFLKDRQEKHFTAIQVVLTQWRTADGDEFGQTAFSGKEKIRINPVFFQRMDERIRAINEHEMIAVPTLLWAIRGEENPGYALPADQRILLAQYMNSRYGAYQVVWFLAGDGDYRGKKADDWKRIGRAVFGDNPSRLATLHPSGKSWIREEFCQESWFSFIGYQSGHGDDDNTFRWLTQGPPSTDWKKEPVLPFINLEPNYEAHNGYQSRKVHDAHSVRRAAYWSLLVSPPAGVTYGAHGIWGWHTQVQTPLRHEGTGLGAPWFVAMNLPGSQHMQYLHDFFASLPWWRLVPAPELLAEQPGDQNPALFAAAAKTSENDAAVIYLPEGGEIKVNTQSLKLPAAARWFHPAVNGWIDAGEVTPPVQTFKAFDQNDWVLCIQSR